MARQIKKLTVYPISNNKVRVILDQQGYTSESNLNKILTQTPDTFSKSLVEVNSGVKVGVGDISSVLSNDPLTFKTSGFGDDNLTGYDCLVVSSDGYTSERGVINTYNTSEFDLYGSAYVSVGSAYHYLMGGWTVADGYVSDVWRSSTGAVWDKLDDGPWSARANARLVGTATDLYLLGGWSAIGDLGAGSSTPTNDLWHASIDVEGALTWDGAAVATGLSLTSDYFDATIIPGEGTEGFAYTNDGKIDLSDGTETISAFGEDGYGGVIHYDETHHILSTSNNGIRKERIIDTDGTLIVSEVAELGYAHRQSSASAEWTITHNLGSFEVAPVCYTSTNDFLSPNSVWWNDENTITIGFDEAVTGRACVLHAAYYSGSQWIIPDDGYNTIDDSIMVIKTTGEIVNPIITNDNTLDFNESTDGYMIGIKPFVDTDLVYGRRYMETTSIGTSNSITAYQPTTNPYVVIRKRTGTNQLINPLSYDYITSESNIAITANSSETAVLFASVDMRHDNLKTLQEPWSGSYASLGVNSDNTLKPYLNVDGTIWKSGSGSNVWVEVSSTGEAPDTDNVTPVWVNESTVMTMNNNRKVIRAIDAGITFAKVSSGINIAEIALYGSLGFTVNASYNCFIYKRPSDIIWESKWGHLPGTITDAFSSHYVLPFPAEVNTAVSNAQSVNVDVDVAYNRTYTANELKGDFLYLTTASTGVVVDIREIITNNAASPGGTITINVKELSTTPTSSHRVQVVKRRPEGGVYYTLLSQDTNLLTEYRAESDGTHFLLDKEQEMDWYAHNIISGGLPDYVSSANNDALLELLQIELNRQRVMSGQFYYDADVLPPDLLSSIGSQYGIELGDSVDVRSQRAIVKNWIPNVSQYGGSKSALENMADLILSPGHGVTFTQADPSSDAVSGKTLIINISNYADYAWTYTSVNTPSYTIANGHMLPVLLSDIGADLSTLIHSHMVHTNSAVVNEPILIKAHLFNSTTNKVNLFFYTDKLNDFSIDTNSVFNIYSDIKQHKIFKLIKEIKRIVPYWLTIKFN